MSRIRKKTWLGFDKDIQPRDPDLVLAKLLDWQRGTQKGNTATSAYPEPINLTAASVWAQCPGHNTDRYAFIYYDTELMLWIKAVAINEVGLDDIDRWCDRERSQGAQAFWINRRAEPARKKLTFNEQDDEPGTMNNAGDPVSLTVRLQQMNKYKIGDCDLIELYPDRFKFRDINNLPEPRTRQPRGPNGVKNKVAYTRQAKPVITPLGIFESASAAAKHYNVSITWVATRASMNKQGFTYITRAEYEHRLANINTEAVQ